MMWLVETGDNYEGTSRRAVCTSENEAREVAGWMIANHNVEDAHMDAFCKGKFKGLCVWSGPWEESVSEGGIAFSHRSHWINITPVGPNCIYPPLVTRNAPTPEGNHADTTPGTSEVEAPEPCNVPESNLENGGVGK